MTNYINCTPHLVKLNDGAIYPTSDYIARIQDEFSTIENGEAKITLSGEIIGLPPQKNGVKCIVSLPTLMANKTRRDLVAPASGHPLAKRHPVKKFVISVPCFVHM